jgi:hypothetical protein
MTNAGTEWLRERSRKFRDRAEQIEDENTRARLLSAAIIYEREAGLIETKVGPHNVLTARIITPIKH